MNNKKRLGDHVRRVGMIFSGGPAPAANSVISSAATAFIEDGREAIGFLHGYTYLQEYDKEKHPLVEGQHYQVLGDADVRGMRNQRGIMIGTARANPGKPVQGPADLDSDDKTAKLRNVYNALVDMNVDALISIGGDDTLKTANYLYEFQRRLPEGTRKVHVVHLPKTIDNDYNGIDFTFGFFTAVDVMAKELLNLGADAKANNAYFIAETMGRKAGWLSYGVGIAGEADMTLGIEDVVGKLAKEEEVKDASGAVHKEKRLDLDALAEHIVDLIIAREERGLGYGTVVLAEGLGELLPASFIDTLPRDDHGHVALGLVEFGKTVARLVGERYQARTGRTKKVTGVQMGYESRCAPPHAFDVMLGSQIGIGAYRALVEEHLDGHMVSLSGQFDLRYVPFSELINAETLKTEVRFIEQGCDFHVMARFLETRLKD